MKRLTHTSKSGSWGIRGDIDDAILRLAAIEDILGEEYDLDRLRELAQADRERHAKHYRWMAPVCVGCPGKTEEGECNGVLRIPGQRGALY